MFNTQIKQHEDYKLTNNCRTAVNITVKQTFKQITVKDYIFSTN